MHWRKVRIGVCMCMYVHVQSRVDGVHSLRVDWRDDATGRRIENFPSESSRAQIASALPFRLYDRCTVRAYARSRAYMTERRGSTNLAPEARRGQLPSLRNLTRVDASSCRRFSQSSAEDSDDNFKYLKIRAFHLVGFHSILGDVYPRESFPPTCPPSTPRYLLALSEEEMRSAFVNDANRRRISEASYRLCLPRRRTFK